MSFLGFNAHLPLALSVGVVLAAATGGSLFALFDHTKRRDAVLWARLLKTVSFDLRPKR
jgi:hypothetical protein